MTTLTKKNSNEWKADKFAFIKFQSNLCGPCKMFTPIVDRVMKDYKQVQFYVVDTTESSDVAGEYGVISIPTCILSRNGEIVHRFSGIKSESLLRQLLDVLVGVNVKL